MTADISPRRAVMADVAAQVGISVMTVSRVLNGFPGVTDETRLRVEEAVTTLGYQANTARGC
jgi:LacI family transcriptional regulator